MHDFLCNRIDHCSISLISLFIPVVHDHAELEEKYDRKMGALRDKLELRRKTEVHEVEEVSQYI